MQVRGCFTGNLRTVRISLGKTLEREVNGMALAPDRLDVAMGSVLRGFRGELRWSQGKMGELLGCGQRTVSALENGGRSMLAAEVVVFSERLATVLPYTEMEIRERFFASPHLRLIEQVDEASGLDSATPEQDLGRWLSTRADSRQAA